MFIIALPQMYINGHYTGNYTPRVLTEQLSGYSTSLEKTHIFLGLSASRYETYLGNPIDYPTPAVLFIDPIGQTLLAREGITLANFSYFSLLGLLIKYPLDVLGIYTRHLISLLTPVFQETYIFSIYKSKTFTIFLSIVLWIIGGVGFLTQKNEWDKKIGQLFVGLLIPFFFQLFGQPEIRFFYYGTFYFLFLC